MKKDAIIDIIYNDLKEIELLLENFRGDDSIQAAFMELLSTKYQNVGKEISLLDYWIAPGTQAKSEAPATPSPLPAEPKQSPEVTKVVTETTSAPKEEEQPAVKEQVVAPTVIKHDDVAVEKTPADKAPEKPVVKVEVVVPAPAKETAPAKEKKSPKASDIKKYGTHVDDIRRAISIGDRFNYQNELFNKNADEMNQAISRLNVMNSYEEAEAYLLSTYGWDSENSTVVNFLNAVHRHFI